MKYPASKAFFRACFYLVRIVRVAHIRVPWLVYLACLRLHVLRAYCDFESNKRSRKLRGQTKLKHGKQDLIYAT